MKKRTTLLLFWLVIAIFIVAMFIPMGCGGDSGGGGGGGDTGSVYGTVTDQNGLPIQSATCSIDTAVNGKEIYSSTTDELGQFTILNVPVGTWTLSISKSGFQTKNITVTVNSGSTTEVPSEETVITPGTSPTPTPSPTTTVTPTPQPTGTVTPSPSPTSSPGPGPGPGPGPVPVPGISGWEWQNPRPQGDNQIRGSFTANKIRISVGQHGWIWREDCIGVNPDALIDSGVNVNLNSVWGSSTGKEWFIVGDTDAGNGVLLYSNDWGYTFRRQTASIPNANLNDVSGGDDGFATNVLVVGNISGGNGTILYSALGDGSDWVDQSGHASVPNADLNGVWVPANGTKAWAVGQNVGGAGADSQPTILYSATGTGADWSDETANSSVLAAERIALNAVYGADNGTNVFAVGAPGVANDLGTVIYNPTGAGGVATWGNQSNDTAGLGVGGGGINTTFNSVSMLPDGTHTIACGNRVGGNGAVIHSPLGTGAADWNNRTSTNTGQQDLVSTYCFTGPVLECYGGNGGCGANENGIRISSGDGGTTWTQNIALPNHLWRRLNGMSAADANNVFAVGEVTTGGRSLILSTADAGKLWKQYAVGAIPGANALNSVWARKATDVYAVGDGGSSIRYDGTNWSDNGSGAGAGNIGLLDWHDVHGYDEHSVYAVGDAGSINRYTGAAWEGQVAVDAGMNKLNGVYCAGTCEYVYAVGDNAKIWKYDVKTCWNAGSWTDTSTGVTATDDLKDVWAADANNVIAVGDDGGTGGVMYVTVDGGAYWRRILMGVANTELKSVCGSSAKRVFMFGDGGSIFFYNGSTVQQLSPGGTPYETITTKDLYGATCTSATDIFTCGALDTIIHSTTD